MRKGRKGQQGLKGLAVVLLSVVLCAVAGGQVAPSYLFDRGGQKRFLKPVPLELLGWDSQGNPRNVTAGAPVVDTEAELRAAVTAANGGVGGPIYLRGQVTLGEYLDVNRPGTEVIGLSYNGIVPRLSVSRTSSPSYVVLINAENCRIRGIEITSAQPCGTSQNGTRTSGSPVITALGSTAGMVVGGYVTGDGIPAGATIAAINSATQITMSANASSSGTSTVNTFSGHNGIAFSRAATGFRVEDCRIFNLFHGLYLPGGPGAAWVERGVARGNRMHTLSGWGVTCQWKLRNLLIEGNWIAQRSGTEAHPVWADSEGIEVASQAYANHVLDNWVQDFSAYFAIELFGCTNSFLRGNGCFNSRFGISVGAGRQNVATENWVGLCGRSSNPGAFEVVGYEHLIENNELTAEPSVVIDVTAITDEGSGNLGFAIDPQLLYIFQVGDTFTLESSAVAGYNGSYVLGSKTATKLIAPGTYTSGSTSTLTRIYAPSACGFAVNADNGPPGTPDTSVTLRGNWVHRFVQGAMLYTHDIKPCGVTDCLIDGNTFVSPSGRYSAGAFAIGSAGIRLQNDGVTSDTRISRNLIINNQFLGMFEGCVNHYNGGVNRVKHNYHYTPSLLAPETATLNAIAYMHPNTGGKVWTDDTTLQTRMVPFVRNGTTTSGSPVITGLSSTTEIAAALAQTGAVAIGTGIPGGGLGTSILSVDSSSQITLSANATASGTVPLTFAIPYWGGGHTNSNTNLRYTN